MQQSLAFSKLFTILFDFESELIHFALLRAQYCSIYYDNTLLLTWDNEINEYCNDKTFLKTEFRNNMYLEILHINTSPGYNPSLKIQSQF